MSDVRDWCANENEDALFADGFDEAIVGVAERATCEPLVVYDAQRCIDILVERGMSEDDAADFFWFNTMGAWVGEETPLFLWRYEP